MCGLYWHQFLTNRNRNTITQATNCLRVNLEFHVPFNNLFFRRLWTFRLNIYHVYVVWRPCPLNTSTNALSFFTFFQFTFTVQLYKVYDIRPPIFRSVSFLFCFFLSKQKMLRKSPPLLGHRISWKYSTRNTKYGWLNSFSISVLLFLHDSQGQWRRIFLTNTNFAQKGFNYSLIAPYSRLISCSCLRAIENQP